MKYQKQRSNLFEFKINLSLYMCFFVLFIVCLYICVCECVLQNLTKIIKPNIKIILIAGVPSSLALLGYLTTAPTFVCVPDVIDVLALWIQNQKKSKSPSMVHPIFEYFDWTWKWTWYWWPFRIFLTLGLINKATPSRLSVATTLPSLTDFL